MGPPHDGHRNGDRDDDTMSSGASGFQVSASLRTSDLASGSRALFDAFRAATPEPQLIGWLDARDDMHDATDEVPGNLPNIGLVFTDDAAFGVLETNEDGTSGLGVQQVMDGWSEAAQRALLVDWTEIFRVLLRQGVLVGARVVRQIGGSCLPHLPLVGSATHLIAFSDRAIEQNFADARIFAAAWDVFETHAEMRLCVRGQDAIGNPNFLAHVLPGHMAMARTARPGLTQFYPPRFEPGELEILEAGEATLSPVGYHAAQQMFEFAGHTPRGTELRCVDLLMAWKIASTGQVDDRPVREVRAVFMDQEQATRSAKLLQEAGVAVYWEDHQGELRLVPCVIPSPSA